MLLISLMLNNFYQKDRKELLKNGKPKGADFSRGVKGSDKVLIEAQGCPVVSAMSEEALDRVIKKYIEEYKVEDSPENLRQDLKWSYADSPYNLYGEQYFTKVQ